VRMGRQARTQEPDRLVDSELRRIGWRVLRLWDFDVVSDPVSAAERVSAAMTWSGQGFYRAAMTDAPARLAQPIRDLINDAVEAGFRPQEHRTIYTPANN
jgi:hypothetical protein